MSRVTPGTLIVAIFAILFGLVGAYVVRKQLMVSPQVAKAEPSKLIRVPMAATDLAPDRTLTLGDIVIMAYTPEQLKKQKLPAEYMVNAQQIIGRTLKSPLMKGETFNTTQFYAEGTGPDVAKRLKPGLRAVTVNIDPTGGVYGLASAGSMVDVLFRTMADKQNEIPETTVILLESVEVLAMGENTQTGAKNSPMLKAVTLAVSAEQASALKIVEGRGVFTLSLRNPADESLAGIGGPRTLDTLLNLPRKETHTSEIYRGTSRQTVTFQNGEIVSKEPAELPVVHRRRQPTPAQAGEPPCENCPSAVARQGAAESPSAPTATFGISAAAGS